MVDDPSAVDVDATTSASVLAPGHVAQMAAWIQAKTGGDLFSIITVDPYSSDYDECLDRAADEKADNARPALSGSVGNMGEYDVVFLGYPIWNNDAPRIIYTFLENENLGGKTIVPFCTSGGSGMGSSTQNLHSLTNGANCLDGRRFSGGTSRNTMVDWVNSLGLDVTAS